MESKKKKEQTVREKSIFELLNSGRDPSLDSHLARKNIVEGNRRILYPLFNLVFALMACVGLLVGTFNRRGQGKIISIEVLCMIIVLGSDLALTNLAGRSLFFLPVLYMNCLVPLLVCFYLLLFYNPFYFRRLRTKERVDEN